MGEPFSDQPLPREQIDALPGRTLLQFGTEWCGHCRAAQPAVNQALGDVPGVRHIKVEDGPGRALGRSYGVKWWPTLVFLQDGREVGRLVRPVAAEPVRAMLERLTAV